MLARATKSNLLCQGRTKAYAPHMARRACRVQRAAASPAPLAAAEPVTAAPAAAGTGPFLEPVLAALERYGDHCKAAYIMFEQFKDNGNQVPAIIGDNVLAQANRRSRSTKQPVGLLEDGKTAYTGLASMRGYACRGNVFIMPTPDVAMPESTAETAALAGQDTNETAASTPNKAKPTYMGYIAQGKGVDGVHELLVAFRGSSEDPDWTMNLLGGVAAGNLYKNTKGRVHQGFHNMVHDVPKDKKKQLMGTVDVTPTKIIDGVLKDYKAKHNCLPPRIICTGHSLGGALATLAAAHIAINHEEYREEHTDYTQRPLQVYTFGAPRVGDKLLSTLW